MYTQLLLHMAIVQKRKILLRAGAPTHATEKACNVPSEEDELYNSLFPAHQSQTKYFS